MSTEIFKRLFHGITTSDFWLKAYFIILPFIFLFQALFMNKLIAIIPSVFLLIPLFVLLFRKREKDNFTITNFNKSLNNLDKLILCFALITGFWVVVEFFTCGVDYFISVLMRYFITLLVYVYVSRFCSRDLILKVLIILCVTSFLISLELVHENINTRIFQQSTCIQQRCYDYVKHFTGEKLSQYTSLLGRPIGILEHNHATSLYIGLGFLASIILFLMRGWPLALLVAAFNFITIFISGVRLILLFTILAFAVILFLLRKDENVSKRMRIVTITTAFSVLVMFIGLLVFWDSIKEVVFRTYIHSIITGNFGQGNMSLTDYFISENLLRSIQSFKAYPFAIPFGAGYPPLISRFNLPNEEFFFLQVFGQYGLIGGVLFYSLFFVSLTCCINNMKKMQGEDRLLLLFAAILIGVLFLSTLHSPVLQRKAIYPYFFFAMGIIRWYSSPLLHNVVGNRLERL